MAVLFSLLNNTCLPNTSQASSVAMTNQQRIIRVRVPEPCLGRTIGELMRIGGTLLGHASTPPMHTIRAEVPTDEVAAFEVWLADESKGEGVVFGDEAANEEDG